MEQPLWKLHITIIGKKGRRGHRAVQVCVYIREWNFSKLPRASQSRDKRSLDKLWVFPEDRYFNADIVHLFIFASFSSTPHVIFQVAAFCQIWQASVFHDTSSQLPDLCNPIGIFPFCSPTFLVLEDNLFNK